MPAQFRVSKGGKKGEDELGMAEVGVEHGGPQERRARALEGFCERSYNLGSIAKEQLVEIDICKAFTNAFNNINKIPVFTVFDAFMPYDDMPIEYLTLDVVNSSKLALFSKQLTA